MRTGLNKRKKEMKKLARQTKEESTWDDGIMREILFKAKRKNWCELPKEEWWVEGYITPCVVVGKWHICKIEENLSTTQIEIDPETICQYTGLTDRNGKMIWENDICRYEWNGRYITDWIVYDGNIFSYSGAIRFTINEDEVIGNIFDNKDLIGAI